MAIAVMIIQILLILGVPLLILKFKDCKFFKLAGTIGIAYLLGIVIALIRYALSFAGVNIPINSDVGEIGSYVAIAIAIPLLLFCSNLKATRKLSKQVIIAFSILTGSVILVSTGSFFIFRKVLENSAEYAGMATGLYTGGTPNLNSIGSILGLDANKISIANLSDMIIGGLFYVFLLFACKPLLNKILGKGKSQQYMTSSDETIANIDDLDDFKSAPKKPLIISVLIALGCAVVSAGIGLLIWVILGSKQGTMMTYLVPALLVGVTVFGICGSFSKKLRSVKGLNSVSHYFILVFSFALSMTLDLSKITPSMLYIFLFFTTVTLLTFIIHVLLCKIFKIGADCCIVTMTAGLYGPAFIPAITKQLDNKDLTSAGLICGSLGYAIGTFIGLGLSYLLMLI